MKNDSCQLFSVTLYTAFEILNDSKVVYVGQSEALRCAVSFVVIRQGSRDNMSVVIVAFDGAPKVSEEAKEKEAELDSRLELKVKGDLKVLLHCLDF